MRISILPSRVDIRNARSNGLVGDRGIWIRVLLPERDFDISTAHKLHDILWPPHRCVETGTLLPPSTGSQGVPGSNSAGAQRHLWLLLFLYYHDCCRCLKLLPRDRRTPWPLQDIETGKSGRQCAFSFLKASQAVILQLWGLANKLRNSIDRTQRGDQTKKKYPPPLSVWNRDLGSSSRLAEVRSLKRNITPGYFHSSRLRHRSWRWRCKHAVDVPLRQLVTWTRVVVSPVSFRSSFPHVGIHNCAEKLLSCAETLSLQTTCTFVQQLQGWMTGRSDSDVMHTCNMAKTPPWTCVLFLVWLHFEYL